MATAPFSAMRSVFRNAQFRSMWLATVASNFGALIQLVGAAWLMTSLTASESMVALVQASNTLPIMLGSFAAGVLADNFDRRRVMLVAQAFMLVVSVLLTVLAFEGLLTPWLLLTFTFLIGCGTALHTPSWQASLGDLVPRQELPMAVSANAMGMNITRSVGPAAGGAIVALVGAAAAFAVNAISYLAIIAALLAWHPRYPERKLPRERLTGAFADGLRYFFLSPNLVHLFIRGFLFGFAAIAAQALLPLVARDQLGGGAMVYGILLGWFGLGAVAGALASVKVRAALANETICRIGFIVYACCSVVVALSTFVPLTAAALFVAGACWLSVLSLLNISIQLSTPRWVLGRMLALYMTGIFGGMACGSWGWGEVVVRHGLPAAFLGSAAVLVFGTLWGLFAPIPPFSQRNLDPVNRFTEPDVKLPITLRSGPIVITVDYEIAEEDVTTFLETMAVRRRIRLRDGAKQWTLVRDVERPATWSESYRFPTWVEYMRHHERRTTADAEISDRLLELHRGPRPFRVHRTIERQTLRPSKP